MSTGEGKGGDRTCINCGKELVSGRDEIVSNVVGEWCSRECFDATDGNFKPGQSPIEVRDATIAELRGQVEGLRERAIAFDSLVKMMYRDHERICWTLDDIALEMIEQPDRGVIKVALAAKGEK